MIKNKTIVLCFIAVLFGLSMVIAQKPCNDFKCKMDLAQNALNANPPQYQKALDLARGAESYDPTKKAEVYDFIGLVFNAIEKKRVEAEKASIKAKKAEAAANTAKEETRITLKKLQETAKDAVSILLTEIDRDIMRLEYDSTFQKCQTAVKLGENKAEVKKRLLEIAYFYTEANMLAAAIKNLKLLNINALPNRTDLLSMIQKNVSPQYFTFLEERYYPKMIKVEGGTFGMKDDSLEYIVHVHDFKIAQTETTVWQYFLYLKANDKKPYSIPSWQYWGDNPMIYVSWYDAVEYANWVSQRMGKTEVYDIDKTQKDPNNLNIDENDSLKWIVKLKQPNGYRLPTEAEWEFAARGGNKTHGYEYSGDSVLADVAWNKVNSNSRTHKVETKKANELNLYDMSGNVWEWCFDWYDSYKNAAVSATINNPKSATYRVNRGGSWFSYANNCRVALRSEDIPTSRKDYVGFRLVCIP